VPGTIAGIFAVHEKWAPCLFPEILKPVIALAEKGYCYQKQEERLHDYHDVLVQYNGPKFFNEYKENEFIKYPALATALKRISIKW
jgi:gamma-glutamyltranspeptidase/glutathione hydrolase